MQKQSIVPITPEDFSTLNKKIGINQDEFCPYCDRHLKTSSMGIFTIGIFYKCKFCGKKFKKTTYRDFQTQNDYFQLEEMKRAC